MKLTEYKFARIRSQSDLDEIYSDIDNFTHIDFSDANLSEVPEILWEAKNLQILDLSNNNLPQLSPGLCNLSKLESLYLNNNKLKNLPMTFGDLTMLQNLYCIGNQLVELPRTFENLIRLEHLYLSKNMFKELPEWIEALVSLKSLFLSDNPLDKLPIELGKLAQLRFVSYSNEHFSFPPVEITSKGSHYTLEYLRLLSQKKNVIKIYEAKLLIVGGARRGKTSLTKKLLSLDGQNYSFNSKEESTEGVEVYNWKVAGANNENLNIKIWDFGGQDIYHSTHQFFLTERSMYLILWDATSDDNLVNFDYWLNIISLLGKNSPVLIVQNKIDERIGTLDESSLKTKFDNIKSFLKISVAQSIGIDELIATISFHCSKLSHIGDEWAEEWINLRSSLQEIDMPVIEYSEFLSKCRDFGIGERESEILSNYFHDLGTFLHFKGNSILEKYLFLKPRWITDAVYKVIDTPVVVERYGRFYPKELDRIWTGYKASEHILILELMRKFELMFQLPDNTYIIPKLLNSTKPKIKWDYSDNLRFEYKYNFMPDGVIGRFIVRVCDMIENNLFWKNGVVIEKMRVIQDGSDTDEEFETSKPVSGKGKRVEHTKALIVADSIEHKISISIRGDDKKSLLAIVTRELDNIHRTLNYPKLEEKIACICRRCKGHETPYFFAYSHLLRYKYANKPGIPCGISLEDSEISETIGEYSSMQKQAIDINTINIIGGNTFIGDNINT